ncbi:hypothetical protein NPIL_338681 [Nephila pilipes]|uniref:Uncharacterized protein n=1 Tax=Nephila pilipes TaxID=299642 RepID=A0A8X6U5G5_NEPPI|nr:hypothetical protein NPIL_338681 [Nephila pilipes]
MSRGLPYRERVPSKRNFIQYISSIEHSFHIVLGWSHSTRNFIYRVQVLKSYVSVLHVNLKPVRFSTKIKDIVRGRTNVHAHEQWTRLLVVSAIPTWCVILR